MRSLHKANRTGARAALLIGGLVLFFLLARIGVPHIVSLPLRVLAAPVAESGQGAFSWLGNLTALFRGKEDILHENEALKQSLARFQVLEIQYEILAERNETLTGSFGRTDSGLYLLGVVLSRPGNTAYDTLLIDIGSDEGIAAGDHVYAHEGAVLGTVLRVSGGTALVSLFSSPGRETDVFMHGAAETTAVARGKGGGVLVVSLPSAVEVRVGDPVTLPALDPILLGTIARVVVREADAFQDVYVRLPINLSSLQTVLVRSR